MAYSRLWAASGLNILNIAERMTKALDSAGVVVIPGYGQPASTYCTSTPSLVPWNYGRLVCSALDSETLWGNATHLAHITTAVDACQSSGWFPGGKVHLLGGSAGALVALKWALANPSRTRSITVAICPYDLEYIRANNVLGLQASVEAAVGNPVPDSENPIKRATELAGIPIYAAYSTNDPVCPLATAEQFIAESGADGINMGAVGHNWDSDLHNGKTQADFILAH